MNNDFQSPQHIPRDAIDIHRILHSLDIFEYEPQVLHQLLEYTNSYVMTILDEAKTYQHFANKSTLDIDDINLAFVIYDSYNSFHVPPPILLGQLSQKINQKPLPSFPERLGVLIPPSVYCLIQDNYQLKPGSEINDNQ